jgi:hypothetical protein
MKPIGIVGLLLVIAGVVVVALQGISYVKDRDTAHVGPIRVTTEQKGFITPLAGVAAIAVGVVLMATAKKNA